jgi:uncharacterized membrane protein
MIGGAAKLATLPLRRRLIGAGIMLVGVLLVLLGFFVNLTNGQAPQNAVSDDTAAGILHHAFDHPLVTNTVQGLADAAVRGAVVAIAAAGALALLSTVASPLRGLAGTGAGAGLAGVATVSGVLFGENTRVTADFSHAPQFHVDLGMGLWILAAGCAVILVGAALSAWRPLAGLFSGIGLALGGAGLGASLALVTGSNHLLGH